MIPQLDDAIACFMLETGRRLTTLYIGDRQYYALCDLVHRHVYTAVDTYKDGLTVHGLHIYRVQEPSHFALA